MTQAKWYGVSSGNDDGVSHIFADYYVKTNDPWRLARLAAVSEFKAGAGHAWALRHLELDGDADYTISATFYDPPCGDTPDGEYPELPEGVEREDAEDGRNWSAYNGVWKTFEVFPAEELRGGARAYDGETALVDCFGQTVLGIVPAE